MLENKAASVLARCAVCMPQCLRTNRRGTHGNTNTANARRSHRGSTRKRGPAGASSYCCMVGMTFAFPACAIGSSWRAVSRAMTAQPTQPRTVRASAHCACGPAGGSVAHAVRHSLASCAFEACSCHLRPSGSEVGTRSNRLATPSSRTTTGSCLRTSIGESALMADRSPPAPKSSHALK